jgi:hypothetical protein
MAARRGLWLAGGVLAGLVLVVALSLLPADSAALSMHDHAEAQVLNAVLRRYVADREQHRHFDPDLRYHLRLYRSDWSGTVAVEPRSLDLLRERGVGLAATDAPGEFPVLVVRIAQTDAAGRLVWAGRQGELGSGGALVYRVTGPEAAPVIAATAEEVPLKLRD